MNRKFKPHALEGLLRSLRRRVHARFAIAAAAVATGVEARICFVVKYCTGIAEVCEREEQRQID